MLVWVAEVVPAQLDEEQKRVGHLSPGVEPEDPEGRGHNHALLAVVRGRHALKHLEPVQGQGAPLGLVGHHASHRAPEDLARGTEVVRPTLGVHIAALAQERQVLHCNTMHEAMSRQAPWEGGAYPHQERSKHKSVDTLEA